MSVRHVSIFLPLETPFYRALLGQMQRGFEACGVRASGALGHLGPDALAQWCEAIQPDVVFEMNRAGAQALGRPRSVRHAAWIVDFDGHALEYFEGSDATYLFGPSWPERFPHAGFHRWLGPGACPQTYPCRPFKRRCGASFAGYIPRPWSSQERSRDVTGGAAALTFGDLLPQFERALESNRDKLKTVDDFIRLARQACRELCGQPLVLNERLQTDLTVRVIRELNRRALVDAALAAGLDIELYGPRKWAEWSQYAPYYRGWLETPAELHTLYTGSALNLHEGNGIHFRSMDIMSSGGLLFFRSTVNDRLLGGIDSMFEAHEHYVPFSLENLPEAIEHYVDSPDAERIRVAAAAEIAEAHTWEARARSILRDFEAL